eukprot:294349-Prymnesium_polylepis.1
MLSVRWLRWYDPGRTAPSPTSVLRSDVCIWRPVEAHGDRKAVQGIRSPVVQLIARYRRPETVAARNPDKFMVAAGLSFERSHTVHAYCVNTFLPQVFTHVNTPLPVLFTQLLHAS